ncbi:MAG: hypothetical protein QM516_03805 [Limnohabitans sp.]|nr:hypothetical protein [Limnohabitans sp.]
MPESKRHLQLKDIALAWLRAIGCRAVASEVSCPFNRYRFDVLGWLDHADDPRAVELLGKPSAEARAPRVIAIECKQSRADFASDDKDPQELIRRKEYLIERRRVIEELRVKVREPHLRHAGSTLFESLDTWEFGESRIAAYRAVVTELATIDEQLGIDTKFAMLARWRVADHLLVMAPHGLLRPREVPSGWGLIEVDPKALRKGWEPIVGAPIPCTLRVAPVALSAPERRRIRLLRNIAVAASRGVGYGLMPPRVASAPAQIPIDGPSLFSRPADDFIERDRRTDPVHYDMDTTEPR